MDPNLLSWGCCSNENMEDNERFINCISCSHSFHFLCLNIPEISEKSKTYTKWKCPTCMNLVPRPAKKDCTPIRNVSTTRGNKRLALNSPPGLSAVTAEEVRVIVQEVIKTEFSAMIQKVNKSMIDILNKELEPLRKDVQDLKDSLTFHTKEFEKFQSEQVMVKNNLKALEKENENLKSSVADLNRKVNYLEQQARTSNIEIQCLPENRQENLYAIMKQLGSVVGCQLKDTDILHATRTAKLNTSTTRPRSVVVQLASPRTRDQLLASVMEHNKKNKGNKLNSSDFGLTGSKTPVYIVEHLSPANKALHAAARLKSKEKGYKYVWVRNGRIFVKKNEDSDHILIKNLDTLNKIV